MKLRKTTKELYTKEVLTLDWKNMDFFNISLCIYLLIWFSDKSNFRQKISTRLDQKKKMKKSREHVLNFD